MIKVNLPTRTVPFPETITVEQFTQVMKWDIDDATSWKHIISIIIQCDINELESADDDLLVLIMGFVILLLNSREECRMNDLEKLTFGEFVDLEVYLSLNYMNHLEAVLKIISPYANTSAKAMWSVEKYLEWRSVVYKQYSGLFSVDESSGESNEEPTSTSKMAVAKSWYATIIGLASDDILKIESVENLGFRMCLNFMAYRKEQRLLVEAEKRKSDAINKMKRR